MNSSATIHNDFRYSATNVISVLICLLAVTLVFRLKLHKKVVYRLALYQVLSSIALAMAELSQLILFYYHNSPELYGRLCVAIAWFDMYSLWMKLLFTLWTTFHLFYFAMFHKNLKRLEALYVCTSLIVPVGVASVPLTTGSYGFSPIDGCYITAYENSTTLRGAIIERFALLDAPAMAMLLVASAAMVVMVIRLRRIYWRLRRNSQPSTAGGDHFRRALSQLLPLAVFPITFFVFIIPVLVYDIYYCFLTPTPDEGLILSDYLFISLWTISSGMAVIVHILMTVLPARCKRFHETASVSRYRTMDPTVGLEVDMSVNSCTSYRLPKCSIVTLA